MRRKSISGAMVLAFFLGPIGMFYLGFGGFCMGLLVLFVGVFAVGLFQEAAGFVMLGTWIATVLVAAKLADDRNTEIASREALEEQRHRELVLAGTRGGAR